MLYDMHFHTTNSDWNTKQNQLIDFLQDKKWDFLFLAPADHDIVSREVVEIIKKFWIPTCESTEISTKNYEHNKSLHLPLYAKSISREVDNVLKITSELKVLMIKSQIEQLNKFGFEIELIDFYNFSCLSWKNIDWINKFDIAKYIFSKNKFKKTLFKINWWQLQDHEFYYRYLKKEWDKYNEYWDKIGDYEPSIETIWWIREEWNSILSIAHPQVNFKKWINEFSRALPHYIKKWWVNAIEINTRATRDWVNTIIYLSEKYWLYLTFWSDNHNLSRSTYSQWNLWELNPNLDEDFVKRSFDKYNYHII